MCGCGAVSCVGRWHEVTHWINEETIRGEQKMLSLNNECHNNHYQEL